MTVSSRSHPQHQTNKWYQQPIVNSVTATVSSRSHPQHQTNKWYQLPIVNYVTATVSSQSHHRYQTNKCYIALVADQSRRCKTFFGRHVNGKANGEINGPVSEPISLLQDTSTDR